MASSVLVRLSRSILGLKTKSVKKKFKDTEFIAGMQPVAEETGLQGDL